MSDRGVLVLGAGGFIGRALTTRLAARGKRVVAAGRAPISLGPDIETRAVGTISAATDWPALLTNVRAVVHLASRAHAPAGSDLSWIEDEAATATALGQAARTVGVERVVLLSSIKVNGENSPGRGYRASDPPAPVDAYGRAKAGIEKALRRTGVPVVVLRPPLVFGPEVRGNFRMLLGLVARGVPLPLASVGNRRSLIFLDNLVDLIELALAHGDAPGGTFLMREDRDVATPELLRLIAQGLGRKALLLPCPPRLLGGVARAIGRGEEADKLLNSLAVDDAETRARLGWRPRVSIEAGIAATCRWYRDRVRG